MVSSIQPPGFDWPLVVFVTAVGSRAKQQDARLRHPGLGVDKNSSNANVQHFSEGTALRQQVKKQESQLRNRLSKARAQKANNDANKLCIFWTRN